MKKLSKRDKTKEKIVKSALYLFATKGYFNTSISMIGNRAKVASSLIYYYFKNKEDLLQYILFKNFEEYEKNLLEMLEKVPNEDKIKVFIEFYLNEIEKNSQFWRLYFMLFFQPNILKKVHSQTKEIYEKYIKFLSIIFKDNDEAKVFLALMDGISFHLLFLYDKKNLKEIISKIKEKIIMKFYSNN